MNNSSQSSCSSSPSLAHRPWESKKISLEHVARKIPNGSSVYIGSTAATAEALLEAMVADPLLQNIQIVQMIPGGTLPHLTKQMDRFRTASLYTFSTKGAYFHTRQDTKEEGLQDYKPISIAAIPRLLAEKKLSVDVALIKVTPPHKGFCSLGMGVESTRDFCRHAKTVIAQVNKHMPWTEGPSKIKVSEIDWWLEKSDRLLTTEELWPSFFELPRHSQETMDAIGRNVIKEIPDGATLRFGVSPTAFSVFPFLHERKNLGLHTDVLTDSLYRLHEEGVFTNALKTIDTGRSVISQAHGSLDMYDFLDRNPIVEVHPMSYVCDPQVLAKINDLICVVGALKVDLTGQVATDSIAHKFYGGVWSDDDSIRGARFSKGGKPIVVLPSKSLRGRSNLVFELPPGTGVSITRSDVEYVVTEYGTAYLYGKSIRERCLALIDIAHPDFRQELLAQAKATQYVSHFQPGKSVQCVYPAELERFHSTRNGREVFVRPIKATDEDHLRLFFHKLSDHSVYLRYFRKVKSMPQRILQKTTDIDYSTDMTIIVVSPPKGDPNYEIVGIAQWVGDHYSRTGIPEIAFQVRDDWQGEGLGGYLFKRLMEIARELGVLKLKADVLQSNKGMTSIFKKSGVKYLTRSDFGVISYTFNLEEQNPSGEC